MALKTFRPLTPTQRFTQSDSFDDVTKDRPEKSLTSTLHKKGGRNNYGRLTSRHRGGGHKQRYRTIDFKRNKVGIKATVIGIEYDPIRSSRIALLKYADGELRYIISPNELKVGATIMNGPGADPTVGNTLPIENIPLGLPLHNLEVMPGKGGQMVRSAGGQCHRDGDR